MARKEKGLVDKYVSEEVEHKLDTHVKYAVDDPIHQVHEYGIDLKIGHIYLMGEESYILPDSDQEEPGVEFAMANKFIKNMNILMRKSNIEKILIHMKTSGGDWQEGMAIYDMIRACPLPVVILNYTHARSMSSLILQAADKRVMMPHSYFMFHDGEGHIAGTEKQIKSAFEWGKTIEKQMFDVYVGSMREKGSMSKKPEAAIRAWLRGQMDKKEDVYLTPSEAIDLGFADEIFNHDWKALVNNFR